MDIFLSFISFAKLFTLFMSILYILKVAYDIMKVYTLEEGHVEMGKYGLITLACSISYIMTLIFI